MITYQNMTPSQTLEERIVSTINTGIDATASKIVCITNGNLLRYKSDTNANFENRIVSIAQTVGYSVDTTATKVLVITDGNLLRYKNDTNTNFEERIVSIANTGIDTVATKVVVITNGNLLRYKTLPPNILTTVYSGVFNSSTGNETVILTLPIGIKFENLIGINILSYYNTVANASWNAGLCWANDHDQTVYFAANSADNPSTATTFRMYRRTGRMALAPYKLTIQYNSL